MVMVSLVTRFGSMLPTNPNPSVGQLLVHYLLILIGLLWLTAENPKG